MGFTGGTPTPKEERRRQGFGAAGPLKELDGITVEAPAPVCATILFRFFFLKDRDENRWAHATLTELVTLFARIVNRIAIRGVPDAFTRLVSVICGEQLSPGREG